MARLLGRHRPRGRWDALPGLRPSTDPVRRARVAGDVLHDRDGALADERDGYWVVAHAVAGDAKRGMGGVEEGGGNGLSGSPGSGPGSLERRCLISTK